MKITLQELDSAHVQMICNRGSLGDKSRIYRITDKKEAYYLIEDLMELYDVSSLEFLNRLREKT